MSHCVILNHHSLPFKSEKDATDNIGAFFDTFLQLKKVGVKFLLCDTSLSANISKIILFDGLNIAHFLKENKRISPETKTRIKSILMKSPLLTHDEYSQSLEIEIKLNASEESLDCLVAAHIKNTFLISFQSDPKWIKGNISAIKLTLDQNSNISEESEVTIPNLHSLGSFKIHESLLKSFEDKWLDDPKDIAANHEILFPNLIFIQDQITKTLNHWSGEKCIISDTRKCLRILNLFCDKLKSEHYPCYKHEYLKELGLPNKVSDESQSTKNNTKLMQDRMATTPELDIIYLTLHISLPLGYRLYFYVNVEKQVIYVGRLCRHLSTTKYK